MDNAVKARRRAIAQDEIRQSAQILAGRFGLGVDDLRTQRADDPDTRALYELENVSTLLKRIVELTGGYQVQAPAGNTVRPGRPGPDAAGVGTVADLAGPAADPADPSAGPRADGLHADPASRAAAELVPLDWTKVKGINAAAAKALNKAGIYTAADLAAAADETLTQVKGVGPAAAKALRVYAASQGSE